MNADPSGETLFEGKVLVRQLPEFQGAQSATAPASKRLQLPQGELAQVWNSPEGARYIAAIELRPGAIRGNHFHRSKFEMVYVIRGTARFIFEELQTGKRAAILARAGCLVQVQPQVAHAIVAESEGWALEFSPGLYNPEDVYRHVVTPPQTRMA